MRDLVSWRDYDGIEGFGAQAAEDIDALNKALAAGQDIDKPAVAAGDGFALRVESLEKTLKVVTYRQKEIKAWPIIQKIPAFNTIEEHNTLNSYAENPDMGFMAEGELPEELSAEYERHYSVIKFVGSTRSVTHVMQTVRPAHGNVIAQETVNGTMHLLRVIERAIFKGNSSLSTLQFDGLEKLIRDNAPASNVIDMRGKPLSEDALTDACQIVRDQPNYGTSTDLFLSPLNHSDLSKSFFPKERHATFADKTGIIGLNISGFQGPTGVVQFQPDVFIDDGGAPGAAVGDVAKRPASPTITDTIAASGTGSKFAADDVGDYFYKVVAVNRYGRSAAVVVDASAVAVTAGQEVTFGVTPAVSTPTVDWYEVYRTPVNGAQGTERQIQRIGNTNGASEQIITDINAKLPGTTEAYLIQNNMESLSIKQLAPMVKIPLAVIDLRTRWAQAIYLAIAMYAYGKNLLIENIGRSDGSYPA